MMHDVMTICDLGLMKLGRLAEREACKVGDTQVDVYKCTHRFKTSGEGERECTVLKHTESKMRDIRLVFVNRAP